MTRSDVNILHEPFNYFVNNDTQIHLSCVTNTEAARSDVTIVLDSERNTLVERGCANLHYLSP
jgi:hypothetical protein